MKNKDTNTFYNHYAQYKYIIDVKFRTFIYKIQNI